MTMTTKEGLVKIYELLEDPAHWTQGANARDGAGRSVPPYEEYPATCWCLNGAIMKVVFGHTMYTSSTTRAGMGLSHRMRNALQDALARRGKGASLSRFNDHRATHQDVLGLIKDAIEAQD